MHERFELIRKTVEEKSCVTVAELAELTGVSEVTIRRDLVALEKDGIITRVRGGAILADVSPKHLLDRFERHVQKHAEEKKKIGERACRLVNPGETIIIDSGSTALELARNLHEVKNVNVIVTSLRIAYELEHLTNITTIVTGGVLRSSTTSLQNPILSKSLETVLASKVLLAVSGICPNHGLTTNDFAEAEVKRILIKHAKEIVVLADHSKLGVISPAFIAPLTEGMTIVTDAGALPDQISALEASGVRVIVAE